MSDWINTTWYYLYDKLKYDETYQSVALALVIFFCIVVVSEWRASRKIAERDSAARVEAEKRRRFV